MLNRKYFIFGSRDETQRNVCLFISVICYCSCYTRLWMLVLFYIKYIPHTLLYHFTHPEACKHLLPRIVFLVLLVETHFIFNLTQTGGIFVMFKRKKICIVTQTRAHSFSQYACTALTQILFQITRICRARIYS